MLERMFRNNFVRGTLVALTMAASTPSYAKPISLLQQPTNSPYHLHFDSQLEKEILLAANGQRCPPGLEHLPECQGVPAPAYTPSPASRPSPSEPVYQPSPRNFSAPPEKSNEKGLGWGFIGAGVLIGGLGMLISTYSYSKTSSEGEHSSGSGEYIGYGIAGIGVVGIVLGIYHLAK